MKRFTKSLCLIMALTMLVCCAVTPASAQVIEGADYTCKTHCGGQCGASPIIIVPGIMQSQVYVQDEAGNDLMTSDGFPIVEGMDMAFLFDTVKMKQDFKDAISDILLSIATGNRDKLLDTVLGIVDENFSSHYFNPDGTRVNDVEVDQYLYSLEECKNHPDKSYNYAKGYGTDENGNAKPTTKYRTQLDFIGKQVDISSYCEKYGYDHTYYYSYSSFGDTLSIAEGLADYIDLVKAQTGHDKVSIVFISLGGTIGNVFLSDYCDPSEIDRVVYAAAAADGSYLLGDLMAGNSTLQDSKVIYNELIPNIVALAADEYMSLAYLGNVVARAIPESLFNDFLNEALGRAINEVLCNLIHNCPSMWALTPSDMYPELSQKLISDPAHAALKAKTDRYYEIQKNAPTMLKRLSDEGMDIFVVCGYNLELPALVAHYNLSSDNIIQSASASLGGTFAGVGSTLPDSYTPAIDASYISPDGIVDAGTCALPDNTWFIKNQSHLKLQSSVNDVIELCVQIAIDHDITDARVNNGGYPQFNEYRNLSAIESMLYTYNSKLEAGEITAQGKKLDELNAAVAQAQSLLESKVWSQAETTKTEERLCKAMKSAQLLGDNADSPLVKYKLLPILEMITKFISKIFEAVFGGNDYWIISLPKIK